MKRRNMIVAGECSGITRDAFAAMGWNAWSCDLKPSKRPGQHWQGSWRDIEWSFFDLLIAHPECTHLAVSGSRWFAEKRADGRQQAAIDEFMWLATEPHKQNPAIKSCIEQPISIMSTIYRKPDQIVQPWQFGHGETKATCYWLKGLPKLVPTDVVGGREARIHLMAPGPDRAEKRSETYQGLANAMASQWTREPLWRAS